MSKPTHQQEPSAERVEAVAQRLIAYSYGPTADDDERAECRKLASEVLAAADAANSEPMTRFCPGCGSVGDVPDKFRDCCPDGSHARMIPASLAQRCHDLFKLALDGAAADAATPQAAKAQAEAVPTLDAVLRLADEHAEESYENGDRRFDRGGLYQFVKDMLYTHPAPQAQEQVMREIECPPDPDVVDRAILREAGAAERKPLTDEAVFDLAGNWDCGQHGENMQWIFTDPRHLLQFARAIERAALAKRGGKS